MSYKELADALNNFDEDCKQREEIAAILRSLDAQPVAWGVFARVENEGWVLQYPVRFSEDDANRDRAMYEKGTLVDVRPLYAAPVAAQPTREQAQRERMEARQWNAKAFDFAGYFAALQRAMQARNATPADVSRATGVSATTLTRMKEGRRPDAASLAALSAWAGLNPAAYVKASQATADFDLPAQSDEVAAQPQQAKPVPLSDAEILAIVKAAPALDTAEDEWLHVARAIEAAHGIKEHK